MDNLLLILLVFFVLSFGGCGQKAKNTQDRIILGMTQDHEIERDTRRRDYEVEKQERTYEHQLKIQEAANKQKKREYEYAQEIQAAKMAHEKVIAKERYALLKPVMSTLFIVLGLVGAVFLALRTINYLGDKSAETSQHNTKVQAETQRIREELEIQERGKTQKFVFAEFLKHKDEFTAAERQQVLLGFVGFNGDTPPSLPESA